MPVSTLLILIIAIVGGVELIVNGTISPDFEKYAGIIGGSSGLLSIGRGLDRSSKP